RRKQSTSCRSPDRAAEQGLPPKARSSGGNWCETSGPLQAGPPGGGRGSPASGKCHELSADGGFGRGEIEDIAGVDKRVDQHEFVRDPADPADDLEVVLARRARAGAEAEA